MDSEVFERFFDIIRCPCGAILTSPRSRRLRIGQRCKWKRDGRPTRKRTKTLGTGMPIDDVPFTVTGGKTWVQMKLE